MFKALLLATVAGAGAANIPLEERGNSPPSYQCSSVNKKCSQAKQVSSVSAYCSSYLKVPKTATKTVTKCQTTTAYSTTYTKTVTKPATTTATTTITGCAYPSRIPAREPAEGGTRKRDAEPDLDKRYGYPVQKPSCLSSHKKSHEITSACKCLSLKPKATQTTTVTTTKIVSRPYKVRDLPYCERLVLTDSRLSQRSMISLLPRLSMRFLQIPRSPLHELMILTNSSKTQRKGV